MFVTYATIAFQLALPFLVYSPWYNDLTRAIAVRDGRNACSFLFCLNIGAFPFISLATLILLVPDSWWIGCCAPARASPQRTVLRAGVWLLRAHLAAAARVPAGAVRQGDAGERPIPKRCGC